MAQADRRWLYGPWSDLLLGCGVLYFGVFALLFLAGDQLKAAVPLGFLPLGSLLLAVPHYGATLLRVYDRREDRHRYAFFAVWVTVAIWGLFVVGLYQSTVGSWLYTIFLTWSPWHYAGQNYGLASMFLRRRGVEASPLARRALYGSFLLSFVLAFLAMHVGSGGSAGYAPAPVAAGGTQVDFLSLGLPPGPAGQIASLVFVAYLGCLVVAFASLLRVASPRDLLPSAVLVASQALWFTAPVVARGTGLFDTSVAFAHSDAVYAFWWVIFAHSAQYLWICSYYAKSETGSSWSYLPRTLVAGAALYGVPTLLFATFGLARVPYDHGLFILVNTAVNLHHFVLDGAIWKLRDGAVAQVLLRAPEPPKAEPLGGPGFRWRRALVWGLGGLCALQVVAQNIETEVGVRRPLARKDFDRLETAERRLRWIGLENPDVPLGLGLMLAERGDLIAAEARLEESVAQFPTAVSWTALGQVQARRGAWQTAAESLQEAIALDPAQVTALLQLGQVWIELGEPGRAVESLEEARRHAGPAQTGEVQELLARARRAAGHDRGPALVTPDGGG